MYRVVIDYEKCQRCGECVKACSMGVIEIIDDEPFPVNPDQCHGCEICIEKCPVKAIKIIYLYKKKI